jgi:hypothetical protein
MPCEISSDSQPTMDAVLTDISLGGAGLKVSHWDDSSCLTLRVTTAGKELTLHCTVRATHKLWEKKVLHTAFTGLSEADAEVITQVLQCFAQQAQPPLVTASVLLSER